MGGAMTLIVVRKIKNTPALTYFQTGPGTRLGTIAIAIAIAIPNDTQTDAQDQGIRLSTHATSIAWTMVILETGTKDKSRRKYSSTWYAVFFY